MEVPKVPVVDDGEGAFPASEETPGQGESRVAFGAFQVTRSECPWWEDYLELRAEGWDWRKAAFIAWAASPGVGRWPATQEELAEKVLGLTSDRTIRKWREKHSGLGERIETLQVAPLLRHRRDVIDALVAVARDPDPKAHQDRKLFLEMTRDYRPRQQTELTGKDGEKLAGPQVVVYLPDNRRDDGKVDDSTAGGSAE